MTADEKLQNIIGSLWKELELENRFLRDSEYGVALQKAIRILENLKTEKRFKWLSTIKSRNVENDVDVEIINKFLDKMILGEK